MLISIAGRSLTRTCASGGCLPKNFPTQTLLVVSRRSKTTLECEPPKKSRKLFTIAGIAIAGTTLAIVAAKNDDEFRDWTRKNIPTLDTVVKVVYKEEETYPEFLNRVYTDLAKGLKNVLYDMFQSIKEPRMKKTDPLEEVSKEERQIKTVYKSPKSAFVIEDRQDDKSTSKVKTPASMKYLKELEDKLFKDTKEAMEAYRLAVEALKDKTNLIDNLDQLISRHDCKFWEKFRTKTEDEQLFSERFLKAIEEVEKSAERLHLQMSRTPDLASNVKQVAENNINHSLSTVKKAKDNLNKDKNNQNISKRSWEKVKMARMYFSEQLETIFPNIWLNDEKLNLPLENLAPFIEYVMYILIYAKKDLHKLETIFEPQITNAAKVIEDNPSDTDDLTQVFVDLESTREKRLGYEELARASLTNEAKCDKANRKSLKDLSDVYNDIKKEALVVREREVERRMQQKLDERLAQLRADHQLEMARMVGRIQGANEAIALRGENEKNQQRNQQFWSAAQSLLSAVKPIGASDKLKESKTLKNEIKNLTKAAPEGDELVKTVISTIPTEVVEQGVVPEECLKQMFLLVEKHARYLAGLPTGPVSLVQQTLARLESILYRDLPIPQAELNNEPIDIEELNNYQLLQRARYYVDRGDLDQAVRYLNLLKGPSGKVASNWISDVIMHLETVQAAELLVAHASASNQ